MSYTIIHPQDFLDGRFALGDILKDLQIGNRLQPGHIRLVCQCVGHAFGGSSNCIPGTSWYNLWSAHFAKGHLPPEPECKAISTLWSQWHNVTLSPPVYALGPPPAQAPTPSAGPAPSGSLTATQVMAQPAKPKLDNFVSAMFHSRFRRGAEALDTFIARTQGRLAMLPSDPEYGMIQSAVGATMSQSPSFPPYQDNQDFFNKVWCNNNGLVKKEVLALRDLWDDWLDKPKVAPVTKSKGALASAMAPHYFHPKLLPKRIEIRGGRTILRETK